MTSWRGGFRHRVIGGVEDGGGNGVAEIRGSHCRRKRGLTGTVSREAIRMATSDAAIDGRRCNPHDLAQRLRPVDGAFACAHGGYDWHRMAAADARCREGDTFGGLTVRWVNGSNP